MWYALFQYGLLLAATILFEGIFVYAGAPAPLRRRALRVCVAANLFTHPLAMLLLWRWNPDFFAVEALVTLLEFLCYVRIVPLSAVRAFGLAFFTNVLTMLVGLFWWSFALM